MGKMATTEKVPELSPTMNSAQPLIATNNEGDANTLSPMENRHVIKSNETSPTKADLMTMSTPPHLLSVALEEGLESRPQRRYYNHRSKYSKNCKENVGQGLLLYFFYILFPFLFCL